MNSAGIVLGFGITDSDGLKEAGQPTGDKLDPADGPRSAMTRDLTLMGLGAGLMYYFDPDQGRRRRALFRDRLDHQIRRFETFTEQAARDAKNRAQGVLAESRSLLSHDRASDRVVSERLRAALGRVVSHPRAIRVDVRNGVATLSGPILADEVGPLMTVASSTRGVREVVDRLEPHPSPGNIPSLQGNRARLTDDGTMIGAQGEWSPSMRWLSGASGSLLLLTGLARGGITGLTAGVVGAGLLSRSVTNVPVCTLLGTSTRHPGFECRDSIQINAPLREVFPFLANYENYPHVLPNVRNVVRLGEGHWRWTLVGPGGIELEIEDVMTTFEPNRFVAWHSIGGSDLLYAGALRFVERPDGGTTVHASLAYQPPGGLLGHGIARIVGYDPKHQLQQLFMRTKSFLETGKTPHDAQDPSPPEHHRVRAGS